MDGGFPKEREEVGSVGPVQAPSTERPAWLQVPRPSGPWVWGMSAKPTTDDNTLVISGPGAFFSLVTLSYC